MAMTSAESPRASEPKDPGRGRADDPTGVRALLSSLPSPGPTPVDLAERINSALREQVDPRSLTDEQVSYALFAGRTRRGRGGFWLGVAVVAAVGLLLGGGFLAGTGALGPGLLGMLGGPAAPSALPPGPVTASTPASASSASAGNGESGGLQRTVVPAGAQRFFESHTNYDHTSLRGQAGALITASPVPARELAADAPQTGAIATAHGLASCLAALDLPSDTGVLVDLATYDGRPAAVLVSRHGDHNEVRVVARDCALDNPALIAGPYPL